MFQHQTQNLNVECNV